MTAAISKKELERLEGELGLVEGDFTYQQRCSRISAIQKGETWETPKSPEVKRGTIESAHPKPSGIPLTEHPFFGKRLLITPMMVPDKNRALYFDEPVGPDIEVEEVQAGPMLYGAAEGIDRMVGDYKVIKRNPGRTITAKTTLPKSGQEISWAIGEELVPVVRGNDGQRGYVWILPTHMRQYGNTKVQIYGLKTLIQQVYPELLPKFAGKPVMMYVDGFVLAASIPQTDAILKEHRRREIQDAKLGLV
jgi:hypothetical protein